MASSSSMWRYHRLPIRQSLPARGPASEVSAIRTPASSTELLPASAEPASPAEPVLGGVMAFTVPPDGAVGGAAAPTPDVHSKVVEVIAFGVPAALIV